MADTSQGDGWWQASDGKWYPPQPATPPPPTAPVAPQYAPVVPQKKSRAWIWVLVAVFVLLVGGCGLLIVAVGDAVDDLEEQDRKALDQTTCVVVGTDIVDDFELEITVNNTTSERSDYLIEYEVLDAGGSFIGDGTTFITNVPAGTTFTDDVVTFIDAPSAGIDGFTCAPIDVDISASN